MPRIRINWKLIIVLLIALIALAATAYGLREWNRTQRSTEGYTEGLKAFEEERWPEAASNLGKYLSFVQDDADILMKYAEAQLKITPLKNANFNQAINAYRRVLRLDETFEIDDLRTEAATTLISLYMNSTATLGEAELIAKKQLERGRDNDIRTKLAIVYIRQRKFEEAASELDSIIKEDPSHIDAYDLMGQLAEQRPEDFSVNAEYWFNKSVENNPASARAYIMRGSYYFRHRQNAKAIEDFERAEKEDLTDVNVKLSLAGSFIAAGKIEKAQFLLDSVYETEPDNISLWTMRSAIAIRSESKEQMCKTATDGLAEFTSNPAKFLAVAAELYIKGGDYEKAAECIKKMEDADAEDLNVTLLKGLMAQQQGRWPEVVSYMRKAIDKGHKSESVYLGLSSALLKMGDRQSAIQQLLILMSQQPDSIAAKLNLSRLYSEAGDYGQAAEHAQAALQIDSGSYEAQMLYARARMQLAARGQGRANQRTWNDLEADLTRLDAASPESISVKIALIQVEIYRKQFDRASELVDQLKKQYPDDIRPYSEEVDILLATDQIDQAITKLKEMTGAFPESVPTVNYLVGLLARQDKRTECEEIVNQAIQRMESTDNICDLNMLLAGVYATNNKIAQACRLLESTLDNNPNNIPLIRRLIRYKYVNDEKDSIQQLIEIVKAIEGQDGWQWRYEQALIWYEMDEYKDYFTKAVALLKENTGSNSDDIASSMLLAKWYERMDELELAISTYRQTIDRAPDNLNLLFSAMALMYKAERYDQADEILARLTRANLADPRLSRFELQKHIREGEFSSASDVLERIVALNPDNSNDLMALALIKMRQNKSDESRNLFNQIIGQDPNSIPATRGLVDIELRAGNNDQALKLCDDLIARLGNQSAYRLRSITQIALGDVEQARKDMEISVEMEPDKVQKYLFKSEFYRSTGEHDAAVRNIREAMTAAPDDFEVQKLAVFTLLTSKDPQEVKQGRELLDKVLQMNPDDLALRLQKAQILKGKSTAPSIAEALKILEDITVQKPKTEQAWVLLAGLYMSQRDSGKILDVALNGLVHVPNSRRLLLLRAQAEAQRSPELAIPSLKLLLERFPEDIDAVIYLANIYSESGLHDKAIELLNQYISTANEADNKKLDIAMAAILYNSGKKTEALEKFKSLHETLPDEPTVLLTQSKVFIDNKMWPELITLTIDWFKLNPEKSDVVISIAESLMADSDTNAKTTAEQILREMLAHDPENIGAVSLLAIIKHSAGKPNEAAEFYRKVLKLEPDNLVIINNLAWILCEDQNKPQEARQLVDRGLALNPEYVDLLDTSGMVYYRLGKYDNAVKDFNKCIELYPGRSKAVAPTYLHLAKALDKLGKKNEAIANLNKSLDANNKNEGLSPSDLREAKELLAQLKGGTQ